MYIAKQQDVSQTGRICTMLLYPTRYDTYPPKTFDCSARSNEAILLYNALCTRTT